MAKTQAGAVQIGPRLLYVRRMADDATTVKIDEDLAVRLGAVADANGESPDDFVRHVLEVFAGPDTDWGELDVSSQ